MSHKNMIAGLLFYWISMAPLYGADANFTDHPGYVDFSTLSAIAGTEPNVEISLKEPLLNMITNVLRNSDEESAAFISKLLRVNMRVFESEDIDIAQMAAKMSSIAQDLDQQGWERVVRVRENGSHVDMYFRLSDSADIIYGIAIMVAEPGDTVMVNIVGDISPNDISALAQRFNIDELADVHFEPGRGGN